MGESENTTNKRGNIRHPIEVPIRIIDENGNEQRAISGNVSDCGLYISVLVENKPEIGSIVEVQVLTPLGDGSEAPINKAKVMRHDDEGAGLKFIFDE